MPSWWTVPLTTLTTIAKVNLDVVESVVSKDRNCTREDTVLSLNQEVSARESNDDTSEYVKSTAALKAVQGKPATHQQPLKALGGVK